MIVGMTFKASISVYYMKVWYQRETFLKQQILLCLIYFCSLELEKGGMPKRRTRTELVSCTGGPRLSG